MQTNIYEALQRGELIEMDVAKGRGAPPGSLIELRLSQLPAPVCVRVRRVEMSGEGETAHEHLTVQLANWPPH